MKIICDQCDANYTVPDEKIPEGKTIGFTCPKCGHKIPVKREENNTDLQNEDTATESSDASSTTDSSIMSASGFSFDESDEEDLTYDARDKPFDFVEEEYQTALVCEADPDRREKIRAKLDLMEYSVTIAENTRDALKNMRYHVYNIVVLNEAFDTANPDVNGILIYLNRLTMVDRRTITLFLLTERYTTFDPMMAYNRSANVIVNVSDIGKIGAILQKGLNDTEALYRVFNEALMAAGRL